MTAYTDSYGFAKGAAGVPALADWRRSLVEVDLDFAKIAAARVAAGVAALAATDTLEVFKVKAGTLVRMLGYNLIKAEGATATMDVGDGATATGFASNINLNGTPGYTGMGLTLTEGTPNTVAGYQTGKLYNADDTVDIVIDHNTVDAARVVMFFEVIDLRPTNTAAVA